MSISRKKKPAAHRDHGVIRFSARLRPRPPWPRRAQEPEPTPGRAARWPRPASCERRSLIRGTLARRAGEEVPEADLTKAEASMKIDELREKTGVGAAPKKRKAGKA